MMFGRYKKSPPSKGTFSGDISKPPGVQGNRNESLPPALLPRGDAPLAKQKNPLYITGMSLHQNALFRLSFAGMAERHWRSHL